jgi:hypothetical protein
MSEIVLDGKEFRKMPYYSTKVSVGRTKGEIDGLLYDHGVENKAWITQDGKETLIFELTVQVGNVERKLAFKFQPTMIRVNYPRKPNTVERETSWRLFYWHLKTKLEAIKYGLVSVERELMSNIIYSGQLTDSRTVGDALTDIIQLGRLEHIDQVALEDKRDPRHVEAKYRVKKEAEQ